MRKGESVHTAETIGMAQRGGSVFSHVRIGENAFSPLIPHGTADVLIGFEPGEGVRALPYLKAGGTVIISTRKVAPITATLSGQDFDADEMISYIKKHAGRVIAIDGEALLKACGSAKVLNTILLGAAAQSGVLGFTLSDMEETIMSDVPERYRKLNLKALGLGAAGLEGTVMRMKQEQLKGIKAMIKKVMAVEGGFYQKKFSGLCPEDIKKEEDFQKLPFTDKGDLREAYPLGLQAVEEEKIVRIHSSSGTTGTPVIIPYTKKDIEDWAIMFRRCYEAAGITSKDRIHITPGYGLWTAGIGFQNGAELLGAMTIPMGPGNTDKQIRMMMDLKSTVLCATSSYALLLAEEIDKRGVSGQIHLKKGVIGSERWGEKMRRRIAKELGVKLYDIYGLTEIYGPGIGISCDYECGMHYWDDYLYFEIIDPKTGELVPDGEVGELVITTLKKEGAPLLRYRTHDLTRFLPGECRCALPYPRIDTILGRTDDMIKVKGVNIFPAQIDEILRDVEGTSSEYQVMIDHLFGKDVMTVFFETDVSDQEKRQIIENDVMLHCKAKIGITIVPKAVSIGDLPRSEKKSTRIFDNRY